MCKLHTKQCSNFETLGESVSNGKTLVANAITAKGVSTSTSASFSTMANNINSLKLAPYDVGNALKGSSFTISDKTNNNSTASMSGKMIYWYHYSGSSNYLKFTTKTFDITGYKTLKVSYVLPTNSYTGITVKLIDANGKSVTVFSGGGTGSKNVTVSSLSGNTYFEVSSQGKGVQCYLSELYLFK